ncbi:hypothetical protein NDU88_006396 [Pleurodeles waltl]|uniref:Uncharacterized protein n=1 Tax=Pleurodeles waltl TaxID=8319 RepID=A0AAV7N0T8_PLEWA|nr:hypothetical protein NDU88_006396 [Pleurodeles waltl]
MSPDGTRCAQMRFAQLAESLERAYQGACSRLVDGRPDFDLASLLQRWSVTKEPPVREHKKKKEPKTTGWKRVPMTGYSSTENAKDGLNCRASS